MKALFDTNVVLDVLLGREPQADVAAHLLSLVDRGAIDGRVCATTVTAVHCIAAKAVGHEQARVHLRELLALFEVAPVDRGVLAAALELGFPDFEDAVLHEAARAAGCAAIVTRNGADFARATISVFSPHEFLAAVTAAKG